MLPKFQVLPSRNVVCVARGSQPQPGRHGNGNVPSVRYPGSVKLVRAPTDVHRELDCLRRCPYQRPVPSSPHRVLVPHLAAEQESFPEFPGTESTSGLKNPLSLSEGYSLRSATLGMPAVFAPMLLFHQTKKLAELRYSTIQSTRLDETIGKRSADTESTSQETQPERKPQHGK